MLHGRHKKGTNEYDEMSNLRPMPASNEMPKMMALHMEVKARKSPENQLHESMVKKMNVGRVLRGSKGMIGPAGSAKPKMVMTQTEGMKPAAQSFMEAQRKKVEEKEAGRKARLNAPKKTDEATEYYKQMAREQRKRRGMD